MRKKTKQLSLLMLVLLLSFMTACSNTEESNSEGSETDKPEKVSLKLTTGNTSSAIYALGGGYAQVIEKELPGSKVTVVGSAGYGENAILVATQQADIGTTSGKNADASFKDKPELKETLAYISTGHQNLQHVVATAESGIKTFDDLKGKKVSVGEPGSGTELVSKSLLAAYGMNYEDIKPEYLSFTESVDAIQNNRVDAILITTLLPNPGILSLATQKDLVFLEVDAEHVKKLSEDFGGRFVDAKIPAGIYDGQTEEILTAGSPAGYVVHKEMSEEIAYNLTKIFIENAPDVEKVHPAASQWTKENALLGTDFPYHPGAVKYYKEIGIWDDRIDGAYE
ncbi:TAXI family TRAP transporter solute-binding subunit [Mesobacillus harenae]|uniref:TAXI family TRAP transporter solute-binding subunit n=1 Tax=Mesobacillus harenae TaxID=2213203 RepID=UPI001580384E|nr:TAXI family TRAP transporter solute-binding subunit [Mesobacillus harenae]